jgi:hypothetical protein
MDKHDLKDGEMYLQPTLPRHERDPVARGWKREGEWLVGLLLWRAGRNYRLIEQGRERA